MSAGNVDSEQSKKRFKCRSNLARYEPSDVQGVGMERSFGYVGAPTLA
jgi:hypothetical protein